MNSRGIFGAFALFAAMQILLAINSASAKDAQSSVALEAKIVSMQGSAIMRSQAELSIDNAIESELSRPSQKTLESEETRLRVNKRIVESFKGMGFEWSGLCSENFYGVKKDSELSADGMNSISKALVAKAWKFAIVSYYVTGGRNGIFPCAGIRKGRATAIFRIPLGYSAAKAVPLA